MKTGAANLRTRVRSELSGFTTVELLVVLTLLAIVAALALPSYLRLIEKRRLITNAERMVSFMQLSQSKAIKRNQEITISYAHNADRDWCVGAVVGTNPCDCAQTDPASEGFCAIDGSTQVIDAESSAGSSLIRSMSGDGSFSFEPVRGMLLDMNDTLSMDMRSGSETFRLELTVSNTGQATLCSLGSAYKVGAYPLCPAAED